MDSIDPAEDRRVDRRTLLKRGLLAGGALAGAAIGVSAVDGGGAGGTPTRTGPGPATPPVASRSGARPNILVIVVDQLRFPQWFGADGAGVALPPNLRRLREGAISFERHYTASNDCTPARSTLVTGLYSHQTGCMITGASTLDQGFPTWGTMLREHGYHTRWLGKWHLTHRDNHWTPLDGERALEHYGFAGGVYPSPDGAPGQGWRTDPTIVAEFADWFKHEGGGQPWCTTVSLVNPHDIAWWYQWTDRVPNESLARRIVRRLPPNFETPELLHERRKPRLQHSLQQTAAASFGAVDFSGVAAELKWLSFLDLYAKLQREVDHHVGDIMRVLHSRPEVAANTVIVFTSDHGEYGASHGLRGKGAGAYEEAIRVPLIVKDLRGRLAAAPAQPRRQLTSSVDVAPLLLTIATGSSSWRREPHHAHIARRLDLARLLEDPGAEGRPYVLHATDEIVTEFAVAPYAANAPLHVVAVRTPEAKFAAYSHWGEEDIAPLSAGEETELYDYSTRTGRLELHNGAGESAAEGPMRAQLQHAFRQELRAPLPAHLGAAHARGFADYFTTARHAAASAAARRKAREEREAGSTEPILGGPDAEGSLRPSSSRSPTHR